MQATAETILKEKELHSDVLERTMMKRAVTINRAELKLAPAVAAPAEATRNGLPFNSNAHHSGPLRPTGTRCSSSSLRRQPRATGERGGRGDHRYAPAVPV
jgi:hypothetical protein